MSSAPLPPHFNPQDSPPRIPRCGCLSHAVTKFFLPLRGVGGFDALRNSLGKVLVIYLYTGPVLTLQNGLIFQLVQSLFKVIPTSPSTSPPTRNTKVNNVFCLKLDAMTVPKALACMRWGVCVVVGWRLREQGSPIEKGNVL